MVVITEKDLPDGNWQHILDAGALQENSVPVIVISWLADNLMWREVLNRGAYDLLAKPLEAKAGISAINSVWIRRKSQLQITLCKT